MTPKNARAVAEQVVEGTWGHSFDICCRATELAISNAVEAEREECAALAEKAYPPCKSHPAFECPNPPQKWVAGTNIAAAIRARGTP